MASPMHRVSTMVSKDIGDYLTNRKAWGPVMYNVLEHGLRGDGVTDDTAALQKLIDTAIKEGRKAIFFPHTSTGGEYFVTSLTNADQVMFFGDNSKFVGGYTGEIRQLGDLATSEQLAETVTNIFNVVAKYGADPTGATDSSAAIQAAVSAALAAGGGIVYFQPGMYLVLGKIVIDSPFIQLLGAGRRNTTLRTPGANTILEFVAGTGDSIVKDIGIDSTNVGVGMPLINCLTSTGIQFYRCFFSTAATGPINFINGSFHEYIDCAFNVGHADTIAIQIDSNTTPVIGNRLTGCTISGVGKGLRISHSNEAHPRVEGFRCEDTGFINTGAYNVWLTDVFFAQFVGSGFDLSKENSVILEGCEDIKFSTDYFGVGDHPANGFSNMLIIPSTVGGRGVSVENSRFYGGEFNVLIDPRSFIHGESGPRVAGVSFVNNRFSATTNCLVLDSVDGCTLIGNVDVSSVSPANGSYAIARNNVNGGSYNFDNNTWHSTTPALMDPNSSYRSGNDRGIVLKNSGKTAFNNSGTTLTINHGCYLKPDKIIVSPEGNVGAWYTHSITDTSFGITWATAANGSWHWEAEVKR